jgi:hypothetical protein
LLVCERKAALERVDVGVDDAIGLSGETMSERFDCLAIVKGEQSCDHSEPEAVLEEIAAEISNGESPERNLYDPYARSEVLALSGPNRRIEYHYAIVWHPWADGSYGLVVEREQQVNVVAHAAASDR